MIPLLMQWQSHSGAAHRKKIDTPSLGWACFEVQVFPAGNTFLHKTLRDARFRPETRLFPGGNAKS